MSNKRINVKDQQGKLNFGVSPYIFYL